MNNKPEWLENAIKRINAETRTFICDTQELADKYKVKIGTTINERNPQSFDTNIQNQLDNYKARQYLRSI